MSWTIRAASRIALRPFSGSTPACAARPWTVTTSPRLPLRDETMSPFARAHSRTRQASASSASRRMCGVDTGEPISSSGLPTNTSRASGTPPRVSRSAAIAYRPASSPAFMSVTPGPRRDPAVDPERALGGGALVEHRVQVADAQERRPGGSVPRSSPMTVSPRPSSLGWWRHGEAERPEPLRRPGADRVDARLGVAAAVGVDQALEVVEERGLGGRDGGPDRLELGRQTRAVCSGRAIGKV